MIEKLSQRPPVAARHDENEPEACLDLRVRPLAGLAAMRVAVVEEVTAGEEDAARLKSLGLCRGRRLQVVKLGDPLIVRVLGSRIGLSARLAGCVGVRPCLSS